MICRCWQWRIDGICLYGVANTPLVPNAGLARLGDLGIVRLMAKLVVGVGLSTYTVFGLFPSLICLASSLPKSVDRLVGCWIAP